MWIGTIRLTLRLSGCRSRKDKRSQVRSMIDHARARFNVSAAEVGRIDQLDATEIGLALTANERLFVDRSLDKIEHSMLNRAPDAEVSKREREIYSL